MFWQKHTKNDILSNAKLIFPNDPKCPVDKAVRYVVFPL